MSLASERVRNTDTTCKKNKQKLFSDDFSRLLFSRSLPFTVTIRWPSTADAMAYVLCLRGDVKETLYSSIANTCVRRWYALTMYGITESQLYRHGSMTSFVFIVWHTRTSTRRKKTNKPWTGYWTIRKTNYTKKKMFSNSFISIFIKYEAEAQACARNGVQCGAKTRWFDSVQTFPWQPATEYLIRDSEEWDMTNRISFPATTMETDSILSAQFARHSNVYSKLEMS